MPRDAETDRRSFLRRVAAIQGTLWIAGPAASLLADRPPEKPPVAATPRAGADADEPRDAEPLVRIGLITDLHSADKPPAGKRHYRDAIPKVEAALADFETAKVDLRIELGDIVDRAPDVATELRWLAAIEKVWASGSSPRHYVLGNHCVDTLTKDEFLEHTGAEKTYYSFDHGGVHFVILDACFREDGKPYGRNIAEWTDTDIPGEERDWLEEDLRESELPTIVFAHQRIDLEPDSPYSIASSPAVRKILESSPRVLAVFQGHHHVNDLRVVGGIPYVTLPSIVEGPKETTNAWGILSVFADGSLRLEGRGETTSRAKGDLARSSA